MKVTRKYLPPIALLLVATIGTAYAATTLFVQTFPAIPSIPSISTMCSTLTPNIPPDNTQSYPAGSPPAAVAFNCGPAGVLPGLATTVDAINATLCIPGCQVVPHFTLPGGYNSLMVYHPGLGFPQTCSPTVNGQTLSDNAAITLASLTQSLTSQSFYEYCAIVDTSSIQALSGPLLSFSVTWTIA